MHSFNLYQKTFGGRANSWASFGTFLHLKLCTFCHCRHCTLT